MNQKNYDNNKAFFALLRAGLWGNQGPVQEFNVQEFKVVDWGKVYQLAQEQSVQGLVLQGIDSFRFQVPGFKMPQVLLLQWIGEVQMIEQRNKDMNAFIAGLIEQLRKNDTYALLVKGQGVAQCYEKPLWRSCGDVDLFLSYDNYEKAKKLLIPLASSVESERLSVLHLGLTLDGWVVELHGKLNGYLSSRVMSLLSLIEQDTFKGGNVRTWMNGKTQVFLMKEENEILYGFIHFLNHFYKEGVGLRQICDWCRLLYTFKDSLNHGLLEQRIKRAGLMSEWQSFGAYAVDYLGMPVEAMPMYYTDAKWKKKADKICAFILEVGNMGHNRGSWLMDHDSWLTRQYVVRKAFSMGRRIGDLINHARIFPLDSLRFFPSIVFRGLKSAARGE